MLRNDGTTINSNISRENRFKCEIETVTVKSSEVICNIITSIIAK